MTTRILAATLAAALTACGGSGSGTSSGSGTGGTTATSSSSGGTTGSPCGPTGVFGTYSISGYLGGTESICGLSLGSFDGGTLTIAHNAADGGATVTVTGSGAGNFDVSDCSASLTQCSLQTASCSGTTDIGETVSLSLSVYSGQLTGSSELAYGQCQAPGLSFSGSD